MRGGILARQLLVGLTAMVVAAGCSGGASRPPTASPSGSPSPSPSPSESPIATASPAQASPSGLTIAFYGDGLAVIVPEPLQSAHKPGEGLDRWEATSDTGRRLALAIQTMRHPPAAQRSLDGLATDLRQQLAGQQGVTIISDERVTVPAGLAQRIAAIGGGEWSVFYVLYEGGTGFSLQLLNLTAADERAIMETFALT